MSGLLMPVGFVAALLLQSFTVDARAYGPPAGSWSSVGGSWAAGGSSGGRPSFAAPAGIPSFSAYSYGGEASYGAPAAALSVSHGPPAASSPVATSASASISSSAASVDASTISPAGTAAASIAPSVAPVATLTPSYVAPAVVSTSSSVAPVVLSTSSSVVAAPVSTASSVVPAFVSTSSSVVAAPVSSSSQVEAAPVPASSSVAPAPVSTSSSVAPAPVSTSSSVAPAPVSTSSSIAAVATSTPSFVIVPSSAASSSFVEPSAARSAVFAATFSSPVPSAATSAAFVSSAPAAVSSSSISSPSPVVVASSLYTGSPDTVNSSFAAYAHSSSAAGNRSAKAYAPTDAGWGNAGWTAPGISATATVTAASATSTSTTTFPTGLPLSQCLAMADNQLPDWAGADFSFSGNVRTYYVTAEQITWNYAPTGWDNWLGVPLEQSRRAWAQGSTNVTGSIGGAGGFEWQKAVYKGYTNSSFTVETDKPAWLGLNGPIVRAEVGDMIQIVFMNKLKANYMNVHSMGLGYNKANEASVYPNVLGADVENVAGAGDAVPPGGCFTYKWLVGPLNVPAPGFDSGIFSYHPYVNMGSDLVTGLVGPVIIYNKGKMATVQQQNREYILLYEAYPEFESWLDEENVQTYAPSILSDQLASVVQPPAVTITGNQSIWGPQLANFPKANLSFSQAPVFMALNGYVYSNMAPFEMCQGDATLWYIYAFGAQSHTFHLHGNNFQVAGEEQAFFRASVSINNGEMATIAMNASRPGLWQAICHVSTHLSWGMEDFYLIHNKTTCPLTPLTSVSNSTIP